jgi:hypothetical protein
LLASASVARRLSRAELDNTLRDLLGDNSAPATRLLPEDAYSPFDNDYAAQLASSALIESLDAFATDVATRVSTDPALRKRVIPCTPTGAADSGCFRALLQALLPRAFRRPLRADELDAYMPLLTLANDPAQAAGPDFNTALGLVLRSVLQDPEFLYRVEIGASTGQDSVRALNDYEIAARISYLVWGSAPDDALRADAEAGRLAEATARRRVVQRLWKDDRAKQQLHRFHALWLGYRAIPHPPDLARSFAHETSALLDRVIFDEPQSYLNLFTFAESHLDATLADNYGLPHPNGSEGWVSYADSGRAGILSHGSVLSAFSKFTDTSPTQRGIFVRTRLLCQEIPPPPATVAADKPPPASQTAVCKKDRYAAHRTSSSCAGCHSLTDGIGFGLEQYDIAGRFRTHDDGMPQCSIEGQGEIVGIGSFQGPKELGALLVDHDLVAPCLVKQYVQFALGRKPDATEAGVLDALRSGFASSQYDLGQLIEDYIASDAFARRSEPTGSQP